MCDSANPAYSSGVQQEQQGDNPTDRGYSILVVEENNILREKLAGLLSRRGNVELVTQMSNSDHLFSAACTLRPDMIVADAALARTNRRLICRIKQEMPGTCVILYSSSDLSDCQDQFQGLGIAAFTDTLNIQETVDRHICGGRFCLLVRGGMG